MENKERYKHLNEFLKNKFGERTLKICLDGGFTCPNRINSTGCIFCGERGSGEHINGSLDISEQVRKYFKSYKAERANKFIAYFQNFSNTFAPVDVLKAKYDAALIDDRIVALAIATRPDCINEEVCKLLKTYSDKYYVWVELGLQTANEQTGKLINRGYTNSDFSSAVELLNKYDIDVVTHIMVGLPGENDEDIKNTVKFLNNHNIKGLKIHCTYVIEKTVLADMFYSKKYTPITLEYYLESVAYILTHINPNVVIHRISGDAPKELLIAPEWNTHKKWIINGVDKIMREQDLWQGKYYI